MAGPCMHDAMFLNLSPGLTLIPNQGVWAKGSYVMPEAGWTIDPQTRFGTHPFRETVDAILREEGDAPLTE